jgi:hypothetical protein
VKNENKLATQVKGVVEMFRDAKRILDENSQPILMDAVGMASLVAVFFGALHLPLL